MIVGIVESMGSILSPILKLHLIENDGSGTDILTKMAWTSQIAGIMSPALFGLIYQYSITLSPTYPGMMLYGSFVFINSINLILTYC